jgi:lysyl-tRNA synthetase class 1
MGTFTEVLRTTFVRNAFSEMSDLPTKLIAFSDDMDALRKIPDNVPNQAMLTEYLGKPLTKIPDPFEQYPSFAEHNNAKLRGFLDQFGFDYEFRSSTEQYTTGVFNEAIINVLRNNQAILDIMLPTLREDRRKTYSPILPISPKTGKILQTKVEIIDAEKGLVKFTDEDGEIIELNILNGNAKLQWKVDWAMRWVALGVDYEMYGKDLTDSGTHSGKIARVLGGKKPEGLIYEMFLDENGEKISKSKGNGLSIEQWLEYGTEKSLAFYAYREPKSAKSLHFGVIPKAVDEYFQFRNNYAEQDLEKKLGNPVHHIGYTDPKKMLISYNLILNLFVVTGIVHKKVILGYLGKHYEITPEVEELVLSVGNYYNDFVAVNIRRRKAKDDREKVALKQLKEGLLGLKEVSAENIQSLVYQVGKDNGYENLREWFEVLYETLLGLKQGPRMGSFIDLYGVENTCKLIDAALLC